MSVRTVIADDIPGNDFSCPCPLKELGADIPQGRTGIE